MRQLIAALAVAAALPAGAETGAVIYREGGEGTARLAGGQVTTPAARFPCAGCHGQTAGGRAEGATDAPPITWQALAASDRPGGSYDLAAFARLLREGIRPDGSAILSLMPRYDLGDDQIAALAALDCTDELEANRAVYAENRRLMLDGLPRAGFTHIAPPDGAFYIYADVSDLTDDARALAGEILEKADVAVTPGLDFDPLRGAGTLRFSYARSTEDIREGLKRLAAFLASRG